MSTAMTRANLCLLFLATLLSGTRSAEASLITWEFAGEISIVADPENQLDGVIVVGSPFSISFTYESTASDRFPNALDHGSYLGAVKAVSGQVGGIYVGNPKGVFGRFTIFDNLPSGSVELDSFGFQIAINEVSSPVDFDYMNLSASDLTGTMFADDSIPLFPPDVDMFDASSFILRTEGPTVYVRGELTSIIPDPTSLILFSLAGVFACRREHHERSRR